MSERPATKLKPIRSALPTWIAFWLLFAAPGRLMCFALPYSANEAAQRLRAEGAQVRSMQTGARLGYTVVLGLPEARTERRFNGWIEPDGASANRSWLTGQTRTPLRSAFTRLAISVGMCLLALFFMSSGRLVWGLVFLIGTLGFVLLAQYERVTGRDRRLYTVWLRDAINALPANFPY